LGALGSLEALSALMPTLKDREKFYAPNTRRKKVIAVVAAQALRALGSLEALPALMAALKDQNSTIRHSAAQALGALGSLEAMPTLIAALKDQNSIIHNSAAQALGALGSLEAIPALTAVLKNQNSTIRHNAAQALGVLGSLEALPALTAALKSQSKTVRYSAAEVLGALGSLEALPALMAALKDQYSDVRKGAAQAIHDILLQAETLDSDSALSWLEKRYAKPRLATAVHLLQARRQGAAQLLLTSLKFPALRPDALDALKQPGKHEDWETFAELLRAEPVLVKKKVLAWAGELPPHFARPAWRALAEFTNDPDSRVWAATLENLAKAGDALTPSNPAFSKEETKGLSAEVYQGLEKCARDDKERFKLRRAAVKTLGALARVDELAALLKDGTLRLEIRMAAQKALLSFLRSSEGKQTGQRQATTETQERPDIHSEARERGQTVLRNLLQDSKHPLELRIRAMQAQGKAGDAEAVGAILDFAHEHGADKPRTDYVISFYYALEGTGSPDVLPFFQDHLKQLEKAKQDWRKDRDAKEEEKEIAAGPACERGVVQHDESQFWRLDHHEFRVAHALARLAPREYAQKLLDHPFRQVRRGAVQAIAGLKDADLLQQLDKARAASEDPVFRHAAYRAIDTGLKRMEIVNQAETLERLRHWQRGTADKAIKDRLAWTIGWVEYRAGLRERG
ncbi:MAG: HEAT repeat domain-containing protein, partial [Gammaproteobacteria bacterium]|nr:HEAT repeat domain-containing protein [Gammaproteobacteria bacterium]